MNPITLNPITRAIPGTTSQQHRAVIYTRVSTAEQVRGVSLEVQRETLLRQAEAQGWPVVAVCEDAGVSGKHYASRPGIQRALEHVERGEADILLAIKIDRVGRKMRVIHEIAERVIGAGGSLRTAEFTFDKGISGTILLAVFAALAQMEYDAIRERSVMARRALAERGVQTARKDPYGYHIVSRDDVLRGAHAVESIGKYVLVEPAAGLLKTALEDYAAGVTSLQALSNDFNRRQVPTPRGGVCWRSTTFLAIFKNPVYKGQPVYGRWLSGMDEARLKQTHRVSGLPLISPHYNRPAPPENWTVLDAPALISEATWDAVQERLTMNRKWRSGRANGTRMLSGRVFCPDCGGPMHQRQSQGGYGPYYVCGRRRQARRGTGAVVCVGANYDVQRTEQAVRVALLEAVAHPEAIAAAVQVYSEASAPALTADAARVQLADIRRQLAEVAQEEAATVQAQIAGIRAGASADLYAQAFTALSARRGALEGERDQITRAVQHPAPTPETGDAAWRKALAETSRVLESASVSHETKRNIVGTVVEKVICRREGAGVFFHPSLFSSKTVHNMSISCTVSSGVCTWEAGPELARAA